MRKHILITNDFPPKVGGIQSYLWELWRRLPSEDFFVHTTPFFGDKEFDGRAVMLDTQMTGPLPTASSLGINGVVSDLSVVGTLTGGAVETRHILLVEPMTSMIASTLAILG